MLAMANHGVSRRVSQVVLGTFAFLVFSERNTHSPRNLDSNTKDSSISRIDSSMQ
jgi:hypothetical protein